MVSRLGEYLKTLSQDKRIGIEKRKNYGQNGWHGQE
jgi:hypothetical protein